MNRDRYQRAARGAKHAICEEIVDIVKASGGRFLKRDESSVGWVETNDEIARDKVSHGFRTKTRRNTQASTSAFRDSLDTA